MGGSGSCFCGLCGTPPPVRVVISGAAGQIAYSLIPMIASGDMFGPNRKVIIHGLDLATEATKQMMSALEMELRDGNFPLLQNVTLTTDEVKAFKDADYAILVGSFPRDQKRDDREIMEKNVTIFRTMSKALQKSAAVNCKVLVVGPPQNTNAFICSEYTKDKLPKENFFAFSRLDQNRTAAMIAEKAKVTTSDVRNVIMWGQKIPDVEHALIQKRPVSSHLSKTDNLWMKESLKSAVESRGQEIYKIRKASAAISAARGIVEAVRCIHAGTKKGEVVSMGVYAKGNKYNIADDIFFSLPVTFKRGGRFRIQSGIKLNEEIKRAIANENAIYVRERDLAKEIKNKHDSSRDKGFSNNMS